MAGPKKGEAQRTVSFFRLVVEDANGDTKRLKSQAWQSLLGTLAGQGLKERTYESPTRRLIGHVLVVDEEYALKLMEPRDENSWLEILRADAAAGENGADAVDPSEIGELVETTIVVFLSSKNLVGIIRGSTASPTHTALAEWLDHIEIGGKMLVPDGKGVLRAEPALSKRQKAALDSSDGVAAATVRISTNKDQELRDAGSEDIADTLTRLKETYGNIFVTITLRVPRGKDFDAARKQLKKETQRLRTVAGQAESVTATLVHYDAEAKSHQEDVDFVSQRVTMKKNVPLMDDAGSPIRNSSAVRAILAAAHELSAELKDT